MTVKTLIHRGRRAFIHRVKVPEIEHFHPPGHADAHSEGDPDKARAWADWLDGVLWHRKGDA